MRGMVAGLATPHPLAETLPALLREDPFARELCASFDEVLAPALLTLDTFADYLDPATTPEDMIGWLAQWLGLDVDPGVEHAVQRHELAIAGSLNATRGTRRSIELALQSALGIGVEVTSPVVRGGRPVLAATCPAIPTRASPWWSGRRSTASTATDSTLGPLRHSRARRPERHGAAMISLRVLSLSKDVASKTGNHSCIRRPGDVSWHGG